MKKYPFLFALLLAGTLSAQSAGDTLISYAGPLLRDHAVSLDHILYLEDQGGFVLEDGQTLGTVLFEPDTTTIAFNRGLPSWNGHCSGDQNAFRVEIRFEKNGSWSPWLTAGYWQTFIWSDYGATTFNDGAVDVDHVKLNSYYSIFQYRLVLGRVLSSAPSPLVERLSYFASDTRSTAAIDYTQLLNDKPDEILIPTQHFYQYDLDPVIGGSICSPTTVSMILRSYSIPVDPVAFARATDDAHWGMFGVWPRVVQNAHEYGLNGAVTQYRSWNQARAVLAAGGRIGMSLGPPLYSGHLVMLAGFDANGDPLVHDPARRDGYAHHFNKNDLALSWFQKGGIGYTFELGDSSFVVTELKPIESVLRPNRILGKNYPNPFNATTHVSINMPAKGSVEWSICDLNGHMVDSGTRVLESGNNDLVLDPSYFRSHSSGIYLFQLKGQGFCETIKINYLK